MSEGRLATIVEEEGDASRARKNRRGGRGRRMADAPPRTGDELQAVIDAPLEKSCRINAALPMEVVAEPEQEEQKTARRRRPRGGKKVQERRRKGSELEQPGGSRETRGGRPRERQELEPERRDTEDGRRRRRHRQEPEPARRQTEDGRRGQKRAREGARHVCPLCLRSAPPDEDTLRGLLDHLLEDHDLAEEAVPAVLNMVLKRGPEA